MEGVPPVGSERRSQEGEPRPLNSSHKNPLLPTGNIWVPQCSVVKNPPAKQMWVRSLGRENPLEKGMATHSSILAWDVLWTEGYSPQGHKELGTTEATEHTHNQCVTATGKVNQACCPTSAGWGGQG